MLHITKRVFENAFVDETIVNNKQKNKVEE